MIKAALVAGGIALAAFNAHADAGAFVGITYVFGQSNGAGSGSNLGITALVTSTRKEYRPFVGAGVSVYPFARSGRNFGVPIVGGYQDRHVALVGGYDAVLEDPVAGIGWVDTKKKSASTPAPPPPPVED